MITNMNPQAGCEIMPQDFIMKSWPREITGGRARSLVRWQQVQAQRIAHDSWGEEQAVWRGGGGGVGEG